MVFLVHQKLLKFYLYQIASKYTRNYYANYIVYLLGGKFANQIFMLFISLYYPNDNPTMSEVPRFLLKILIRLKMNMIILIIVLTLKLILI